MTIVLAKLTAITVIKNHSQGIRAMRVLADTTFARVDILPSKTGKIRVGPCPPKNDLASPRFDSFGPILSSLSTDLTTTEQQTF